MEGLLCLSKPAKEYAEFQLSPSENNNADTGSDDAPTKASLSGKLSSTSMTSVGSTSAVSNEDLKDFLEQMKWHINNKLDNTRIEMMELRKKVNSIDEKLKMVLEEKDGSCDQGNQDDDNGTLEAEDDKVGADGDGGGGSSSGGNGKGGIRRGSGSLAKSIKGVFMNSNNNKMDRHSNGGGNGSKPDKQTNGGPIAEEEEVEKRKTVTFGQDVVVKEFQRVFSGRKRSKKGQKLIVREEVVEEDEEEAEAGRIALEDEKQDDIIKENGNAKDEDIDDFTDSEEETENREATLSPPVSKASIDLAKEREASWRNSKSVDGANEYQNTTIKGPLPEDDYEVPVKDEPPALPSTASRPPIKRVVDDNEDFYEDPDDQESGRGSMPPGSCSDEGSGNTFVFPQKGEKTDYHIDDDFNSDSTDYEDVEDVDLHQQEKRKKPKVDKLDEFKNDHSHEEDIDLIDRLLMLNNFFSTIKSVGKWEKRYCIAKDGQLFIYKSYKDKQSKAQRLPMMGYTVFLLGQQGKQDHVIKIDHHNLKPPLLLASDSAETSNKWVTVLKRYSTINHTIVPGGQQDEEEPEESPDKKKGTKFFSREKKDGTPQLTVDGDVLSGYVNICGAKYGETKIRRKWITLKDMVFSCSATKDDQKNFSFSIRGIDVEAADKKEVKMKGAFKLMKDGEVYLYIEALNMLDAGHLLKQLVSASMNATPKTNTGGRPASSTPDESGVVARLLASFENAADQTDTSQNFKGKKDKEKEVISPTESAPGEKKETEKERKQREKKEKKKKEEEKKKEKKEKDKKEKKKKEEEVAPSTPTTPSTPSAPSTLKVSEKTDEIKKPSPALQRKASAPVNKFKDSNMSHLLVKDKLMQDRKELETRKKELTTKRGDLRAKKMSSSDPVEKEKIQKEVDVVQKELSELSKKLVKIASEMEDATGNKKDANANSTSDSSSSITKKPSVRAASPDRESVSKGTVSDRMKMFQQGK